MANKRVKDRKWSQESDLSDPHADEFAGADNGGSSEFGDLMGEGPSMEEILASLEGLLDEGSEALLGAPPASSAAVVQPQTARKFELTHLKGFEDDASLEHELLQSLEQPAYGDADFSEEEPYIDLRGFERASDESVPTARFTQEDEEISEPEGVETAGSAFESEPPATTAVVETEPPATTITVETEPPATTATVETEPPATTATVETEPPATTATIETEPPATTVTVETEPPATTVTVETEPPATTATVETEPPATTATVETEPPATTATVETEPPVTTTTVETEPPATTIMVETEPPATTATVETEPPATTATVETEPPVTTATVETEPPATTATVETEPPATTIMVETEPPATTPAATAPEGEPLPIVVTTAGEQEPAVAAPEQPVVAEKMPEESTVPPVAKPIPLAQPVTAALLREAYGARVDRIIGDMAQQILREILPGLLEEAIRAELERIKNLGQPGEDAEESEE
ncbi:MAG: hypothetical protein HQL90_08200 [Magnetococcales bacterium]|nr:hypothetical protein [Magnetococcales bacterium]